MKFDGLNSISDLALRRLLQQVEDRFTALEDNYGLVPVSSQSDLNRIKPPGLAEFDSVTGANGKFIIRLKEHGASDQLRDIVIYEIQTSSSVPFSSSPDLTTYGPDYRHYWEITDSGVTKYLRVRSRFVNSKFNNWVPWPGGAVAAGLISSSAIDPAALTPTTALTDIGVVAGSLVRKLDGSLIAIETLAKNDQLYGPGGSIVTLQAAPLSRVSTNSLRAITTVLGNVITGGVKTLYAQGDCGLNTFDRVILVGSIAELDGDVIQTSDVVSATATSAAATIYRLSLDASKFCYINNVLVYFE